MNFWKRQISDPIRGLTLDRLVCQMDAFQNGHLAEFALTADAMENRDDMLKNVITKRKKAVTRHGWEILTEDCSAEAEQQRDVLSFFYRNLRCSHALRDDERGGFQMLVYQMMDAVGKGFAAHEIIWKPVVPRKSRSSNHGSSSPSLLTADFRFVPLWYFEATSGRLRFVTNPGALRGEPLSEKQWLITVGDALMIACSRAFLFKHYPLQAWLDFSQKFGLPGVRGTTSATRGTPEFSEMEDALRAFMSELAVVTNTTESIDLIELKGTGQPPFSELVERMDRVMASLWRGADLSTLSRDRGYGATLQEQEARVLEQDDARTISEHLNATVDRWVLEQVFGPTVQPLARIKILVSPRECTPHDLAIDQFLVEHGARLSIAETLERYGRAQAVPGESWLRTSALDHASQKPPHIPRNRALGNSGPATLNQPNAALAFKHMKTNLANTTVAPDVTSMKGDAGRAHIENGEFTESTDPFPNASLRLEQSIDDYIQISPIGLFPHARGLQNVDRPALENLVKNFNSFLGRLGRRFAGIPFYVGHPDVPGYENMYSDRKAYGWIMDLQAREDGLYARTNWGTAGRELITNGHFKFLSPFWEAKRIGDREGRGVFSPTVLKSVGLTNEPNLPVLPLANAEHELLEDSFLGTPVSLISSANLNERSLAERLPNSTPPAQRDHAADSNPPAALPEAEPSISASLTIPEVPLPMPPEIEGLKQTISNCQREITDLQRRLLTSMLDNALAQSRILPVERAHWLEALTIDFENASAALANSQPKLNTVPRSANLVRITCSEAAEQKQKKILALVNEKMRSTGLSYHEAWIDLRAHQPEIF